MMRVLIDCETSGVVREAFRARGHHAVSCDLLPADDGSPHHVIGDAITTIQSFEPDLLIAHPPCTYLCNSGVRWLHERRDRWMLMEQACGFFRALLAAPVDHIAIENPVMHGHARQIIGRGPDQTVQPWQFGHGEVKRTCFWLKNLPPLRPTEIVEGREARVHRASPGPERWKVRSRTYEGIAAAMADQWVNWKSDSRGRNGG